MSLEYRVDHRGVVQLQVARQRSFCWPALILLLLLFVLAGVWLYFSGYLTPVDSGGSLQALSLRGKMNEQVRLLEKQSSQILQLESQTAAAVRSREVQESANEVLRRKLVLAESELAEARQHLSLYEEILSPKDMEPGLHVQHFAVKQRVIDGEGNKLEHDRYYQYHLVLANLHGDGVVAGRFMLELAGALNGKDVVLKLSDVLVNATDDKQPVDRFSLKYYQSIEGNLELPPAFVPKQVTVSLHPESIAGSGKVTKTYAWDAFNLSKKSTASKE
jgi:hypothetical protein